ncbi:MAG: AraC family transcriptional regulator [Lachnospiraceae bacterium]|nr:AraC family transcriptional regulator [Lachnospiraceae bacterium]
MSHDYREYRQHGTQQFPCAYYNAKKCGKIASDLFEVKHHWHEEIELMFLVKGRFHVEINMQQYQLESPCICVINSGELHALRNLTKEYAESAVVFHPRLLAFQEQDQMQEKIINELVEHQLQLPRVINPGDSVWQEMVREYETMEQTFLREARTRGSDQYLADTAGSQLVIKASLLKILACLQTAELLEICEPKENVQVAYIKTALSYFHEHYREKVYIRDLASCAGLNEQYFCRLFRRVIRMSPVEYMNSYRMKKAVSLLERTDLSVTEVAYECGFHDMGGFIREFKKLTETTPLQYRKKFRMHS